ncbi:MAG: SEL1-like repeat protein [Woeseiaceae bacterium]|nr:SEL1-like repeat protein [Woeseiaceae bacterium]
MSIRLKIFVVFVACFAASGVFALDFSINSGSVVDAKTLSVQAKAEELFERGDYKRAHFIYRHELAPIGDKYAQYMVGFMSLTGLGVKEDPVLACAWYRLAAERKAPEFVAVRDELMAQFDAVDIDRADEIYLRLRRQYSDVMLRMRLVRGDYESMIESSTGSRMGAPTSPVTIVRPRAGTSMSGDAYYGQIHRRMQKHLDHITATLDIEPVNADLAVDELADLERKVDAFVALVDDR